MFTIEIDEDVMKILQAHAQPFIDTPNSVLRKLLGLVQTNDNSVQHVIVHKRKRAKSTRGYGKLTNKMYRKPILETLQTLGGIGSVDQVLNLILEKLKDKLKPVDFEILKSGAIRWRNTAQWERYRMMKEGIIKKGSPRGIWELENEYKFRRKD